MDSFASPSPTMHIYLSIPHICKTIFYYYENSSWPESGSSLDPYNLKQRYVLAWVCRDWRKLALPSIYKEVHIYIGNITLRKGITQSFRPLVSPRDVNYPYYFTSNLHLIPNDATPEGIRVHYEDDGAFRFPVESYMWQMCFGKHNWETVTRLSIFAGKNVHPRPDTTCVGTLISYAMSHAPNIGMLSVMTDHVVSPELVTLRRIFGDRAETLTMPDIGSAPIFDVSDMAFPSLEHFSIDCTGRSGYHWVPKLSAGRIGLLKLNNISADAFFHVLQSAGSGDEVVFSQLDCFEFGFGDIADDTVFPDYRLTGPKYRFPKLTALAIRTLCNYHPDLYWMFKDSPLQMLSLAGDTRFICSFDVARFPLLHCVNFAWNSFDVPPDGALLESKLIAPASSIEQLHVTFPQPVRLLSFQFGCTNVSKVMLSFTLSAEQLESALQQLPCLGLLSISYTMTVKADEDIDLVNLRTVRDFVVSHPLVPLSTSLQTLVITEDLHPPHTDKYSLSFIRFIDIIARVPSLVELFLSCSLCDDGLLLSKVLADSRIGTLAPHFTSIDVDYWDFGSSDTESDIALHTLSL